MNGSSRQYHPQNLFYVLALLFVLIRTTPGFLIALASTSCPPYAEKALDNRGTISRELAECSEDTQIAKIGIVANSFLLLDMGQQNKINNEAGDDLYFYEFQEGSNILLDRTQILIAPENEDGSPGDFISVFVWGDGNPNNNGDLLEELPDTEPPNQPLERPGIGIDIDSAVNGNTETEYRFVLIRPWPPDQRAGDGNLVEVDAIQNLSPPDTPTATPTSDDTSTPTIVPPYPVPSSSTPTPTITITNTPTTLPSETNTPSSTSTATYTPILTPGSTLLPTNTSTTFPTNTPTLTSTPLLDHTTTPSHTPISTNTSQPPTNTPTLSPSYTPTPTQTPTPPHTATATLTPTNTSQPPTNTSTPSPSYTPTSTQTPTPPHTATATLTPTNTSQPPTNTPILSPSHTPTPTPPHTSTATLTPTNTSQPPTNTPILSPSYTPTPTPPHTSTATLTPTNTSQPPTNVPNTEKQENDTLKVIKIGVMLLLIEYGVIQPLKKRFGRSEKPRPEVTIAIIDTEEFKSIEPIRVVYEQEGNPYVKNNLALVFMIFLFAALISYLARLIRTWLSAILTRNY